MQVKVQTEPRLLRQRYALFVKNRSIHGHSLANFETAMGKMGKSRRNAYFQVV